METSIKFHRLTFYTGRNGMCKASGIELWSDTDNCLVISPFTSKGKSGACDIAIPRESIPELINLLKANLK